MQLHIYSIFDAKASAYLPPFYLHNDAMAVRVFADCVNSEQHAFSKHPEDYTLFHLGIFDDSNGKLTDSEPHTSLGNGLEHSVAGGAGDQLHLVDGAQA